MNITFRQLRVFSEVARLGHMGRAAEALHLTPPAVSMQIKELESQVGLPLFDRIGRSLSLSTAGEYFLVHARRLLADLKDTEHAMARLRKLEHGVLTIGLVSTAKYFVPHLLARFNLEHPGVEVRLRVAANREELVSHMQAGDADLTIMGRPPKDLDARAEVFAPHPLVFIGPVGHPLGARSGPEADGAWPAQALAAHGLIAREPASGTRAAMDAYLAAQRVQPRVVMEMPSSETIKQAVIAGMGIGFLSLHTVGLELRHGLLRPLAIQDTPVMRGWNVVHLRSKVLSPSAEAFRYFMLEKARMYLQAHDEPLLAVIASAAVA